MTPEFLAIIANDAFINAYEGIDSSSTFSELMESFTNNINQFTSEEVLISLFGFSEDEVNNINGGSGADPDYIDNLIDDFINESD